MGIQDNVYVHIHMYTVEVPNRKMQGLQGYERERERYIYGYPPIWGPLGFFTPRRKPLNHQTIKPTERATMGPAFETRHVSRFRRDLSYIILLSYACINSSWLFTVLLVLVYIYVAYQSCCCL